MSAINVAVVGAAGKMGAEVVKGVLASQDFRLVAAIDVRKEGHDAGEVAGFGASGVKISKDLRAVLCQGTVDAVVDFTSPKVVMGNIRICFENKVPAVVGTTGITAENIEEIRRWSDSAATNAIIAPNFTIGAVLMMLFAQTAAKYFSNVEIIELHHNNKVDAPSGTAIKTAEMIIAARDGLPSPPEGEFEKIAGSRGGELNGIRLHAVRLPGFIAHQEVIFGDAGQILTIRHDSMSRECYIPGVLMAVKKLREIKGVVYGLENLL